MPDRKVVAIHELPSFIPTLEFIKREEDLELTVYLCPAGVKTVGWGHALEPHDGLNLGDAITQERALQFFEADVIKAYQALFRLVRVPLSDSQHTALVSFIFNLGSGRFQASTLRQKINRGEVDAAAQEFDRWIYARDPIRGLLKLKGLASRRRREKMLFLGQQGYATTPKLRGSVSKKTPKPHPAPFQPSLWQKVAAARMGAFKRGV